MKHTSDTLTLGNKTYTAIKADYDSYTTEKSTIILGGKTFEAVQTKGVSGDSPTPSQYEYTFENGVLTIFNAPYTQIGSEVTIL